MKLLFASALVATVFAHGDHGDHAHDDHGNHFNSTEVERECGTEHDEWEIMQSEAIAQRTTERICSHPELQHVRTCQPWEWRVANPVTIPTWYHVIHNGNTGRLSEAVVQAQFRQTNLDFSGLEDPRIPGAVQMDITFSLAGTTYTDNAAWFADLDANEVAIKARLAVDNRRNFNQYFGNFRAGLLGFCYFPNSFAETSTRHGCMNLFSSVPGGSSTNYNQGKTTTHETGHGIGLFHTFQGGCNGNGDQVADTCNQASPTSGCPASRNSCPNNGCLDPINNYMDYSFDRCMTQFTPGQNRRANVQLSTFRPSLYLGEDVKEDIEAKIPGIFDEAKKFAEESEVRYMAKRRAKGYDSFLYAQ